MTDQVGELLWKLRTSAGLSLGQLSRAAGISKGALSQWEAGLRTPRVAELEATLTALNVSAADRALVFARISAPRAVQHLRQAPAADGLGTPPISGDLLRALRLRKGYTQEQTAALVGVGQTQVARWERGDRHPSAEQMQALCFALEAQETELIALTTGHFIEPLEAQVPGEAGAAISFLQDHLDRIRDEMFYPLDSRERDLYELHYFALERAIWMLALTVEAAIPLLARAYAEHSELVRNQERWSEVGPLATRTLELLPRQQREPDFVLRGALMHAAATVYAGPRVRPGRGVSELRSLVPRSSLPEFTAWIVSDTAKYASLDGQHEAAVRLAQQACHIVECGDNTVEVYLRRMDRSRLLLAAGRPLAALQQMPEPRLLSPGQYAHDLLLAAELETLTAASTADERVLAAHAVIEAHGLDALRPKAERLTRRSGVTE